MASEAKAAIVTGAGTGVGRETAILLAERGYDVLVNYSRSKSEAQETAQEVQRHGRVGLAMQADVANDSDCRALIAKCLAEFGRLDLLVNNAATTSFIPHVDLEKVEAEDWTKILAVNLIGPFQCARAAKDALVAARGQIVNIASIAGISATGSSIPYCASKAGLINMTMSLARVFAPEVRVNAVAPGFITGRWLQNGLGPAYEKVKSNIENKVPLGRVCEPIDVARAVLSLVEGSPLVTGQTLVCDGGMLLGPASL